MVETSNAPKKLFEVKKWNAVALWQWGKSVQPYKSLFKMLLSRIVRSARITFTSLASSVRLTK